jgi:hypothetical protein
LEAEFGLLRSGDFPIALANGIIREHPPFGTLLTGMLADHPDDRPSSCGAVERLQAMLLDIAQEEAPEEEVLAVPGGKTVQEEEALGGEEAVTLVCNVEKDVDLRPWSVMEMLEGIGKIRVHSQYWSPSGNAPFKRLVFTVAPALDQDIEKAKNMLASQKGIISVEGNCS